MLIRIQDLRTQFTTSQFM